MTKHEDLALAVDAATDDGNEQQLRELADDCLRRLKDAEGAERVRLHYYKANCHAGISTINSSDPDFAWSWEQPHDIGEVLALRRAIKEPLFSDLNPILVSQIRTNLGNRLNSLGRPIAANEQWIKALVSTPSFAKALCNRARGLRDYSARLYDENHQSILLAAAREEFAASLADGAIWESDDRDMFVVSLESQRDEITNYLTQVGYREDYDLDQWGLGDTPNEVEYRNWSVRNRLFLNPLNEAYSVSVAATDVLHLPSHNYKFDETPRFPAYFNLLKQEYVSARYRLYRALHEDDPEYVMRDVSMFDTGEGQVFGHHTEELRSALRAAYSLFDKVSLFLNDYFKLGHKPSQVSFVSMWREKANKHNSVLHPTFQSRRNWPLRGLYFLSRDLLDSTFKDVAEPDAAGLARLRHQAEHRFLSLQYFDYGDSTETHELIGIDSFGEKTLSMLKLAREALVYVSLAMHREEEIRAAAEDDDDKISVPIVSLPIDSFDRF